MSTRTVVKRVTVSGLVRYSTIAGAVLVVLGFVLDWGEDFHEALSFLDIRAMNPGPATELYDHVEQMYFTWGFALSFLLVPAAVVGMKLNNTAIRVLCAVAAVALTVWHLAAVSTWVNLTFAVYLTPLGLAVLAVVMMTDTVQRS
ncbi:hypothetical protein [uncultured Corynebacterium sp.]|uniref:hypothetical protein n=1 Tax=uncultured Corynebacterium sp. TaxID=159447 RepID=UPI0025D8E452|nr:hypothetical protein [uncultured Corynebacterium sp.]